MRKSEGFNYYQFDSASDYTTNFNSALESGYRLQFVIYFTKEQAIEAAAVRNNNVNYAIIDSAPIKKINNLSGRGRSRQGYKNE